MSGSIFVLLLVLWPMLAAFIVYITGRFSKRIRDFAVVVSVLAEAAIYFACVIMAPLAFRLDDFCGLGISLEFYDFRLIYTGIAVFMWLMTAIFSCEYFKHYRNRNRYYFFFLMTLGATMGVFLSADLYTTFIFFEIMSLTSYVWVAHDESKASLRAAGTYLAVAVIGGLVMLMGIFILYSKLGTLRIDELYNAVSTLRSVSGDDSSIFAAGILILFGFGAKAGMFPLHIWLPKAHPVAPAPASALLSGILTKSGIFGVLILCCEMFRYNHEWGTIILILGVITMVGGAVLALFSVDLKRTLACSSMSQIGFILVGAAMQCFLGEEGALASTGTLLHMVNHSMFKLLLFMVAGSVYMNLHKLNLNDIRGYGRNKPFLKAVFAIGAMGIAGVPLLSGYVSKTLIHESIVEYIAHAGAESALVTVLFTAVEWLFLISGGMTAAYMLKLFAAVFVDKGEHDKNDRYISLPSKAALILPTAIIIVLGTVPSIFINKIGVKMLSFTACHEYEILDELHMFSLTNLKGSAISLLIGIVIFILIRRFLTVKDKNGIRQYLDKWPSWLDIENGIYRPLLLKALPSVFTFLFEKLCVDLPKIIGRAVLFIVSKVAVIISAIPELMIKLLREFVFCDLKENKEHRIAERMRKSYLKHERNVSIISASISFGMLLLCLGLCFTLFYLISLLF